MRHRVLFAIPLVMLAGVLWSQSQRTGDVPSSIQRVRDLNEQTRQLDSVDHVTGKRQFSSDGQWQMSEIVKAQYVQLTSDMEKLNKLTNELRAELANPNVLSVGSMRKAEEMEKLAKKVRSRLKGWF